VAADEAPVNAGGEQPQVDTRQLIHDIRNLLAVIINYSELIVEETADPEAVRADIKEIQEAAERAITLTEKLPRPPRVDAGESKS
jgi:signal transduction histidine kinase